MADIYIIGTGLPDKDAVKELCVDYSVIRNIDISVTVVQEPPGVSCTSVFLMPFDGRTAVLSRLIRSRSVSYILLIIDDASQLMRAINPMTSASGFVIRPVKKDELYSLLDCVFDDLAAMSGAEHIFRFRVHSCDYSLPYSKILYFEADNKRVLIRTASQEMECGVNLGTIEEQAPPSFVRTHKSFIVNMEHISKVDYVNMEIELKDGSAVYVSRSFKARFKERLEEYYGSVSV